MPHPSRLKYTQMFNSNDRNKKGTLTGKHSYNQKLRSMSSSFPNKNNNIFESKIVNIILTINFNMCSGHSKEPSSH